MLEGIKSEVIIKNNRNNFTKLTTKKLENFRSARCK